MMSKIAHVTAVAMLFSLALTGAFAQEAEVYINPTVCSGIILLGRCFTCKEFGLPTSLRSENGELVCGGCPDDFSCSEVKLTDAELEELAAAEGDGIYFGLEWLD